MKILVVTGASGGHIFPAVSFIEALRERHREIDTLLVLPKRGYKPQTLLTDCKIKYISTSTITLNISRANLIAIARFFRGIKESLGIILEFKPDIVVGFGSLDSLPCLFFGWLFRIKTLIHEQNVLPGKANRLLAHFSDRVAVSFAETKDYLNINPRKVVLTGNPLRKQLRRIDKAAALDSFGLSRDKFTLLVMGGSQGSRNINSGFLKAIESLDKTSSYQVIHLTGELDYATVKQAYERMGIEAKVFVFFENMEQVYSASDLAVSRAGATTIAELSYFGLPAVLIPYPFAYAHQYNNARVLEEAKRAAIINDSDLDSPKLKETLSSLINDPEKINIMRRNCAETKEGCASLKLAELAVSLI